MVVTNSLPEFETMAGNIITSVYCVASAIYPLLFFLFVSDDDHPIIESVGFSGVDNINMVARWVQRIINV
ncbi:hypothetical protein H0H92_015274 [Tricholoma furcatifolium]|nr:hypothetical protein H0H92_015274 [Tricholoma furcatifolium]